MITLNFNNPNSRTLTEIEIYRAPAGTAIPDIPVEAPIAVLDGFATQYVDYDTVLGEDYNYRFKVFKPGGEIVMSDTFVFGDVSLYGPGGYEVATSGTDGIWDLGTIGQVDELPSITELALMAGPNSEFYSWSGQWRKFKIGSQIYYTPLRGAVHIYGDDFEAFMSRASSGRLMDASYCSYELMVNMAPANALAILDGRSPTKWDIAKEFPRQNALEPYVGSNAPNARLIFAISDEMNGQTLAQQTGAFKPCVSSNIYMTTHQNFEWYWKPILRFIPKTDRNYP